MHSVHRLTRTPNNRAEKDDLPGQGCAEHSTTKLYTVKKVFLTVAGKHLTALFLKYLTTKI